MKILKIVTLYSVSGLHTFIDKGILNAISQMGYLYPNPTGGFPLRDVSACTQIATTVYSNPIPASWAPEEKEA